ncbi:P-II family nitrogen regulator [Winogradskyella flava]|uniref:P-II family nitrogen regulator n=1 Tax=Winogradskyella flava TaxID=1884876 RepID=UPI00249127D0|nr:P-II family nitrogen regulator [Winogradskyella flava]
MKKIEAIIRKPRFDKVKRALHEAGVNFFSYWDINAVENEKDIIKKLYLSVLVNDDFEDVTIKAILESGFTGKLGDGRIFISTIDEIYKIRTKENGVKTLR